MDEGLGIILAFFLSAVMFGAWLSIMIGVVKFFCL